MQFIEYNWIPYTDDIMLRNPAIKYEQINSIYPTGLTTGVNGFEFTFVPTLLMSELHSIILDRYNKIKIENHKVEECNEIYYTTKIEGCHITYARTVEIHDGKPIDKNDYFNEMMIKSGFEAIKYMNVCGNRLSDEILINMWNILVEGCCQNQEVRGERYRVGPIYVGGSLGLDACFLEEAMSNWIDFYNSSILDDYPFIKAALLHVSYEIIHPFCDGNGRSGRLLMINYLIDRCFDKCKAISFSKKITERLDGYYKNLALSRNIESDCTPFIEYMLYVFKDVFEDILYGVDSANIVVRVDRVRHSYYIKIGGIRYNIKDMDLSIDDFGTNYVMIGNKRYNLIFTNN